MGKSIKQRFSEMTRLYHFTSFNTACRIIESGKLRFGKLYRMNDLIENNKIVFQHLVMDLDEDKNNGLFAEEEMHRYQQISFSQDRRDSDRIYEGFNLHPMWGLYADKGYGACLVFDKDKLKLEEGDYANKVEYVDLVFPDYGFRNKSKAGGVEETRYFLSRERNGNMNKNIGLFVGQKRNQRIIIWMYRRLYLS